jgi:CBS domain-containing protein
VYVQNILKDKGTDVVTTGPDRTIVETARLLHTHKIGAVLVVDGKRVIGILSERDIARSVAMYGERALSMKVRELMTADVLVCSPHDTVSDIMALMTARRIRHVPVMEDGELRGIISIGDVVKIRMGEVEMEAESLREYVMGHH